MPRVAQVRFFNETDRELATKVVEELKTQFSDISMLKLKLPAPSGQLEIWLPRSGSVGISGNLFKDCADCPEMVVIPAGEFQMGSNAQDYEKPIHKVSVDEFALGRTEITQGQWRAVMGNNHSEFNSCGDDCPVERVSWNDAQEFISKLNAKTGKQYRLPSEAEWEYACRADKQQEYCGSENPDIVAWHFGNSDGKTQLVGLKQPNTFGLYDMSGNVWEWVEDNWHGNYNGAPVDGSAWQGKHRMRVLRGGSWSHEPQFSRAAIRSMVAPALRLDDFGFRVARMLP